MNLLLETFRSGGPVVWVILVLSLILYSCCYSLLLYLRDVRRRLMQDHATRAANLAELRTWQDELQETFRRQRVMLGAMIAAAPLLGLLGTVTGMIATFGHLSSRTSSKSIEGLADGISEALISTQAGLTVAIPAVLLLYYAHRQMQKAFQTFTHLEHQILEGR